MRLYTAANLILALCFGSPWLGRAQTQTPPSPEPPSLADVAQQYRERKLAREATSPDVHGAQDAVNPNRFDPEDQYRRRIRKLLALANFDELETEAAEVRSSKARFPGGVWKLYVFYEVSGHPTGEEQATESDWNAHLTTLKSWVSSKPQSITAHVALANGYLGYAWKARGAGLANTVTDLGLNQFEERVEQAKTILMEAKQLSQKCPYWYEAMQIVALAQGWDKEKARALLEEAISFEPHYHHYYREYVFFLLPKWYGAEGEAEAFAAEVADRIGGQEGAFVYFELASVIHCPCTATDVHPLNMSWPRIQQGYDALKQLYGTSSLKENRFAYLAYVARDKLVARDIFARIGANWAPMLWRKWASFESARAWAMSD